MSTDKPSEPLQRLIDRLTEPCPYCSDGKRTGLPSNACENCMNTGLKHPELLAIMEAMPRQTALAASLRANLTGENSMNAMAPCPKDSALMTTWETYKTSEQYKNSHSWATRYIPDDDPQELERIRASGANPWTKEMKVQAVEGSLWAAFLHGWIEAGGTDPHKPVPTIAELQALLDSVDDTPIEIMPNGSIRRL